MGDEIDLRQYLGVIWRRRVLIAATILSAVLVAGVLSFIVFDPVYEASALLLVSQPRMQTVSGTFASLLPPLTTENLIPLVHNEIVAARIAVTLKGVTPGPRELVSRVKLSAVRGSNLLRVTARDSTPGGAEALARGWSEAIVAYVDALALEETGQTLRVVEQKVAAARSELATAEEAFRDFQAASRIPILSQRVAETVQRVALYESRLAEIEQGGAPVVGEVTLQPTGNSYALTVTSLRDPARLRRILAVLRSDLDKHQRSLATERQRETQLLRQMELARSTHQLLVQKREELRILLGSNTGAVRVGMPPVRPQTPAAPRPALNFVLAGVVGSMAGIILAFVAEYFTPMERRATATLASPPAVDASRPVDD